MTEIQRIPFHGTHIYTVMVDGLPLVVLRPTIEGMGLNYGSQLEKLKKRSWATVRHSGTVAEDGKVRDMATVDLETWSMLLANIDENKVAARAKDLVVFYQVESGKVLKEFWMTGEVARRPDVPQPRQPVSPFGLNVLQPNVFTYDEVCAILRQNCGVDLGVNELTRMLRHGGLLKQNGAPTAKSRHFFWFTGSCWNVVAHMMPQLTYKVCETGREIQDFRFIQMRLEIEGVGRPLDAAPQRQIRTS